MLEVHVTYISVAVKALCHVVFNVVFNERDKSTEQTTGETAHVVSVALFFRTASCGGEPAYSK